MQRTTTAVLVALLVIGVLSAVPLAMAQQTGTETNQTSGTGTVAPGAQLSGVVGVGEAELDGDVESRAYGIRIARANSSDAKAAVVAEQLNATEQRLTELETRKAELETARENGSLSEGQYRAQVAKLHAESQSATRLANQTSETASRLPAEALEANGVDVMAIRTLSERAANLTGPETAEIARSIAGGNAGQSAGPGEAGTQTDAGSDRAGSERDRAGSDGGADTRTATDETSPTTSTAGSDRPN
jgi:hypothetical protein